MSKFLLESPEAAQAGPAVAGGKGWQLSLSPDSECPAVPGFVIQAAPVAERHRGEALLLQVQAWLTNWLDATGQTCRWRFARQPRQRIPQPHRSPASSAHINVLGLDALVVAVQDVLNCAGDLAALAYRERMGLGDTGNSMAVVIMPLLPAVASGVAFTIDPITGREDQMVIHANWGLGEALVVGQTDGDEYRLQRDFPQPDWSLVEKRTTWRED